MVPSVVNPAHRLLSLTVNPLHKVLGEKDGERELLSVEGEVVNPAHSAIPTVNHLHMVLREKDVERASLLRENQNRVYFFHSISYLEVIFVP